MIKEINVHKKILKIGIPVAFENLVINFTNFVDNFMVGKENPALGLGAIAIAGLGSANQIFFIFIVCLFGLLSGASVLSAQYYGVKDKENLKKILNILIISSLLFSLPFIILGIFFPKFPISFYTNDTDALIQGIKYFRISCLTFPLAGFTFVLSMQLRVINKAKYAFYSSVLSLLLNVCLNSIFIPIYGVVGAAIATLIARILSLIYIIYIINKKNLDIDVSLNKLFNLDIDMIKKVFKISAMTFIHEMFWVVGSSIRIMLIGKIGPLEIASIHITQTISSTLFSMFSGISNASSVLIGNELGANKKDDANNISKICLKIMVFVGIISSVILLIIAPIILKIMNISIELNDLVIKVIYIESILLVFKAVNLLIIVGILRVGGDIYYPMALELISVWLVSIPLVYLGVIMKFNIYLIYFLLLSEELFKILPAIYRYRKRKWLKKII